MQERFYHALIENSYDAIAVVSEDTVIKFASPSFRRITGYEPGELLGRRALDFVYPEDLPRLLEQFSELVQNPDKVLRHEFRFLHKDGGIRYAEATGCNLLADPDIEGIVINFHDVTEYKQSEARLAESEKRFRMLVEQSLIGVTIIKDGVPMYVNETAAEITGYRREELTSFKPGEYAELIHPDDRRLVLAYMKSGRAGEQPGAAPYVCRLIHKSGLLKKVAMHNKKITVSGEPVNMVIMYDVTEQERSREVLEKITRLFLGLGTNVNKNVRMILETGREALGAPLVIYIRNKGRHLETICLPEDEFHPSMETLKKDFFLRIMTRDSEEPLLIDDLRQSELLGNKAPEHQFPFDSLLGYSVECKGKAIAALCFFQNTGRKFDYLDVEVAGMLSRALSIEEERVAQQQGLKDFIDIIAHEIRHPLTVLRGYTHMLKDYSDRLDEKTRKEALESSLSAMERLENLIGELLDISRIEREHLSIVKREIFLHSLIERSLEEIQLRFPETPFSFSTDMDIRVKADPERIMEVLLILLENAVKYSPEGSPVDVGLHLGDDEVVVSVMDRGYGIPLEERTRIFERFYQLEEVRHHSIPGIGLGLYIAREIVEAHGGRIWCADRQGGGTVFRFTLPL